MELESALVVEVPAAEPLIGELRRQYDKAAGWGVPAHVTVLYPFVPPADIDESVMATLTDLFSVFPIFEFSLDEIRRFAGDVLFLNPNPADRFSALTEAITVAWPEYPPYGGIHDEVIPHVTIAAASGDFDAIERQVSHRLPVQGRADRVSLMTGSLEPNSWHTIATFELGQTPGIPGTRPGIPVAG